MLKNKDYQTQFLQNPVVVTLQKAIFSVIISSESAFYQWKQLQWLIDLNIFWSFLWIAEILIKNNWEDTQIEKSWTEIIRLGYQKQYIDIVSSEHVSDNFLKDLKELSKMQFLSLSEWDEFEKLIETKKKIDAIDKAISGQESKKYHLSTLYDSVATKSQEMAKKVWISWYSSGIPTLDKYIDWLQPWTLTRLTAYSNIGKSKLSYHVCNSMLEQWLHVIYFSLEVTKERVVHNLMMNWYNKDYYYCSRWQWLDDPNIDTSEFFSKNIEIIDDMSYLDHIVSYSENRSPDVIFIDFVQNIRTKYSSEYESMTCVATELQQLAIRKNIVIFDMSQIANDSIEYKSWWKIPSKWSWALVASADVNLVMVRDKQNNHNNLYIAKNKFWMNWKCIDIEMDFSKNQIYDRGEEISKTNTF